MTKKKKERKRKGIWQNETVIRCRKGREEAILKLHKLKVAKSY